MTKFQQVTRVTRALSVLRNTTNLPAAADKPRLSPPKPLKKGLSAEWLKESAELRDYRNEHSVYLLERQGECRLSEPTLHLQN